MSPHTTPEYVGEYTGPLYAVERDADDVAIVPYRQTQEAARRALYTGSRGACEQFADWWRRYESPAACREN